MDEDSDVDGGDVDEDGTVLPLLLEAVLSVGTDIELHATLQHLVDSAAGLTGARYG
ncbi:histidine kinase, partial [Streptomyces gardneri]